MILLDPKNHDRPYADDRSREVMLKAIEFFEGKGKAALKRDDREQVWYGDFLEFARKEKLFATTLTPAGYGAPDSRWDTWRNCEFAEILAFYGLAYWYTWQVSVLGLGPIWMSENEEVKARAARLLEEGASWPGERSTTSAMATRQRWCRLSEKSRGPMITSSSWWTLKMSTTNASAM
jgi:acyl-CoA dehydrogenase